jgi:integrase
VVRFPRTKEARARTVPLHAALIQEGFIEYWRAAQPGFLFVGDRRQKDGAKRTPAELRASEIAAWIQEKVILEDGVSPNHGWRHTFLTIAEGVGISKRHANAIAGHNRKKDASDGYVAFPIEILKREIDRFPFYPLD